MYPTFSEVVGAALVLLAGLVVSYAAIFGVKTGSGEAMTALVGVVGAGVGFFLRGRVDPPAGR